MSAVHQHGKTLARPLHLPNQNGIPVAYIDEIQLQHAIPPMNLLYLRYHTRLSLATGKEAAAAPKFSFYF